MRRSSVPKVSVVIPTYNCSSYLKEAVDSVLNQTYRNYEVLVVDDGSSDGTRCTLEPYLDTINYIYQENRGAPAARNTGIRAATGEFIALLDADDVWLPEKLQLQMEYFESHENCSLVYTDMKTFDEHGVIEESIKLLKPLIFLAAMSSPSFSLKPYSRPALLFSAKSVYTRLGRSMKPCPMGTITICGYASRGILSWAT
jgi:glycosyltransferase involved in cell wall biosynthesis